MASGGQWHGAWAAGDDAFPGACEPGDEVHSSGGGSKNASCYLTRFNTVAKTLREDVVIAFIL